MPKEVSVEDLLRSADWCRSYDPEAEERPGMFAVAELMEKIARTKYITQAIEEFEQKMVEEFGIKYPNLDEKARRIVRDKVRDEARTAFEKYYPGRKDR